MYRESLDNRLAGESPYMALESHYSAPIAVPVTRQAIHMPDHAPSRSQIDPAPSIENKND